MLDRPEFPSLLAPVFSGAFFLLFLLTLTAGIPI